MADSTLREVTICDLLTAKLDGLSNTLSTRIDGIRELMEERDARYHDRELANKDAIKAAFDSAEKAAEKTELALKEYKFASNEWRDTVKDLVAKMITRPDVERELKVIETKIADLREAKATVEGSSSGRKTGTAEILITINLIISAFAVMSILFHIFK